MTNNNTLHIDYTINKGQFYDDWLKDYIFYSENDENVQENSQKCPNCDKKCEKMAKNR